MPYADESQQREAQREWWRANYEGNPAFQSKELKRKKEARAAWTPKRKKEDRDYMREFMREYRAKQKLKQKALSDGGEAPDEKASKKTSKKAAKKASATTARKSSKRKSDT